MTLHDIQMEYEYQACFANKGNGSSDLSLAQDGVRGVIERVLQGCY